MGEGGHVHMPATPTEHTHTHNMMTDSYGSPVVLGQNRGYHTAKALQKEIYYQTNRHSMIRGDQG